MSETASHHRRIVVFGSANHDHVLEVEAFPRSGETVLSQSYRRGLGGKGANQAVAAAAAGADVRFVGAVGRDGLGDDVIANLASRGIDIAHVVRREAPTGVAVVLVAADGANEIVVAPGANAALDPELLDEAAGELGPSDIVVVQCEIPTDSVAHAMRAGGDRGAFVIANLAPFVSLPLDVLRVADILIVNESEARGLVGDAPTRDALAEAVSTAVGTACIVTLGESGSVYARPDGRRHRVTADRVGTVVDTTGAGDVYVGALAASLATGAPVDVAMAAASTAAAVSVSRAGAQAPHPAAPAVV